MYTRSLRLFLFYVLFNSGGHTLLAQLPALKFTTYTTANGLLHNYTKKCIEDHKGFIWVTSEIGVSRFDGVTFKNFQHDEADPGSILHNSISDITVDDRNQVWFATEKGLCYYSYKTGAFTSMPIEGTYHHEPAVQGIVYDSLDHQLWFVTDKGLYGLNVNDYTLTTTSCQDKITLPLNQLYLSTDHRLWIAHHRNGFSIYDIAKDLTAAYLPGAWITCFYEGQKDTMWLGNWHSLQLVAWNMKTGYIGNWVELNAKGDEKNLIMSGLTINPVLGDSLLLISTQQMGIRIFNIRTNAFIGGLHRDFFVKYNIPTDFTNYIFTDSRGILWVCTWNGLSKMNIDEQQFRTQEIPFLSTPLFQHYNLVNGLANTGTPGVWWLGINNCGLIQYDTATKSIVGDMEFDLGSPGLAPHPGTAVEFLIQTTKGEIWSGNDVGLDKIEKNGIKHYELKRGNQRPWMKTICIAPDETFWICAATFLYHFDPATGNYQTYDIDSSLHNPVPIRSVPQADFDNAGMLWIGTIKGLFQFDTKTHKSKRIQLQTGVNDPMEINTIQSLVVDRDIVYLGTLGGLGIYHISTGQFELKGKKENVFPISWKSMLKDDAGNLWIYTPHALYKYNTTLQTFSSFTTADGIHEFSSDPSQLFKFQNNFYIGYRGAFTEFNPLEVNDNTREVIPMITECIVEGKELRIDVDSFSGSELTLPVDARDITFYFTGIEYTNSDKITFSYQLDDEGPWREAGTTRSVQYTNLPPGHHHFQLRARNSSGLLSGQIDEFHFYLTPALWQRWWFWPLLACLFVTAVVYFASRRVRKIKAEEAIKTQTNKMLAELETKLLRSQMNPHFIFNSLNSIQKYIWENKEEDAAEYLARFAKLIRAILENSRKEKISLKEELETLKLYIELEHRRSNGKFDYGIKLEMDIPLEEVMVPPLLLQPYVENAIWHGVNKKASHGHIQINISREEEMLIFNIDDDGVGRNFHTDTTAMEHNKTSIGTAITLQRIAHLQAGTKAGSVEIIDKKSGETSMGTTVIIRIPINTLAHA